MNAIQNINLLEREDRFVWLQKYVKVSMLNRGESDNREPNIKTKLKRGIGKVCDFPCCDEAA